MINVHGLRRNVKNVVKNYSDTQIKVREATSNDPWGPSGTLMSEISDLTYNIVAFPEIMQILWKRLNDHGKNWKHVYKALVLLEYLLKSGSEKVAQECKENIFVIETLKDFQYTEDNKDQGINVREKAKLLAALLKDEERLRNERLRALKARERFARSSSRIQDDILEKLHSADYVEEEDSLEPAFPPTGIFISDLEQVRPSTAGEEELQLQLALAMSKEEADQAERLKRNDELRLQMALNESRECYEQELEQTRQNKVSAVDELAEVFAVDQDQASLPASIDPWGLPLEQRAAGGDMNGMPNSNSFGSIGSCDQDRVGGVAPNNSPNVNMHKLPANSPDLIASTMASQSFDMSGLRKSLSADNDVTLCTSEPTPSPSKFLGHNANLVNLETLVEYQPPAANPFQETKSSHRTINELRFQNTFPATLPRPVTSQAFNTTPGGAVNSTHNPLHDPSNNPFM